MKLNVTFLEEPLLEELAELVTTGPATKGAIAPERLLILEDDRLYARILERHVSAAWPKCVITVVDSQPRFVAALECGSYDLILSDYFMPHFSGVAALAIIQRRFAEIPFIFVSGAMGEELGVECLKLGAKDYLMKDRLTRLVPAIERALDESRKNQERKLVIARLEQSNQEYHTLVNSVDGVVWQADQGMTQFSFVSQQVEQLLGYPREDWMQKRNFWRTRIHPDDAEAVVKAHENVATGRGRCQIEYRMMAEDGQVIWLRESVSAAKHNNGCPQIHGIMMDVTQAKQAEAEINSIQTKLQESNRILMQKNEEIQSFYHTLSHELKTPLTSAREFVSLVMEGIAGPLTETQMEYLGIAKKSCDQLCMCINDLLDATRVETGKMSLDLKPGSLPSVADRVVTALRSQAMDRGIMLEYELTDRLGEIYMDEHRMAQTLTNLINNAIKHTDAGGRIKVETRELPGHPHFVLVSVSDTGCGIPEQEKERIFNRLYQIKAGDATSQGGIGLGLYLCKELVQSHGGEIWVESKPGQGSQFKFILPKDQLSYRPNVLVMDDDPSILEVTCAALEQDYNVRRALNGEEGMEEMRRQTPDLVLLDLSMPLMDGVAVLKELRSRWAGLPVIVHTAYTGGEIMKRAMDYSPFTLLSKPNPITQLQETVRNTLRATAMEIPERKQMMVKAAMASEAKEGNHGIEPH